MLEHCLEDLIASDDFAVDGHFDRGHQTDEHGTISEAVECAWLCQEDLQDFHKDLVVKQVDPEASFDSLLLS